MRPGSHAILCSGKSYKHNPCGYSLLCPFDSIASSGELL